MIPLTVRRGLVLTPLLLALAGCNTVVLNPSGDIAKQQADLITVSVLLMLLIIVPVMFLIVLFAWRYRKGNTSAKYEPDWDHSTKLELVIWGAPLLIIIALGLITWISTHKLDPYRPLERLDAHRPIAASTKPLTVQVVAMDWKWLFIYPEQGIATVNELVLPVDQPVRFKITSTTVMNAFYVPELAGMVYAMPGMQTELNAVQNKPVVSRGLSANYSGAGFSDMIFAYRGVPQADFDQWIAQKKAGSGNLNRADYLQLAKPSVKEAVRSYAQVEEGLYNAVLNQCVAAGTVCLNRQMADDARRQQEAATKESHKEAGEKVAQAEICTTPDKTSVK
ncbi:ubiquinol oxidase subunit II [Massilia solisilvae]|uniref:Ubiquinol oxidase subunit 2 n=1 Tax=Massilia solisilvae TaxID=1811225 RepID=A0ABT2BHK6_9BURK|nr:ubiquinol oxidase subunit II [Massilia solisilvae]MCS0607991.1 ubiquinol oxidase subunit II [Massilia solisilvae]